MKKQKAEDTTFIKLKKLWYAQIFSADHKIIDVSPPKQGKLALCAWVHNNYRNTYSVS